MKTTLLSLALLMVGFSSMAMPGGRSRLEISSQAGLISVSVDRQFFGQPTQFFSLNQVKPGNRYIEIWSASYQGFGAPARRLFSGRVYIQPGSVVQAVFHPTYGFQVRQSSPLGYSTYPYQNFPVDPYMPYQGVPGTCGTPPMQNQSAYMAMGTGEFNALLETISDQWTEANRLAIAQQGMAYSMLNTQQVIAIMGEFYTESARLEFAKAAFHRVVDPHIYYMVNEAFWSSDSVLELSRYIQSFL